MTSITSHKVLMIIIKLITLNNKYRNTNTNLWKSQL